MANRPIFLPNITAKPYVTKYDIDFQWYPGLSKQQKQKSVLALHAEAQKKINTARILDISTSSLEPCGVSASAFNLMIPSKMKDYFYSVECAFQASKIFTQGGPFTDILEKTSSEAKKDCRLRSSGELCGFRIAGENWPLKPTTLFYDWLYINALHLNSEIARHILLYDAFTDIEFNPKKSLNCQARSAAMYVALHRNGLLEKSIHSKAAFVQNYPASRELNKQLTLGVVTV